MIKKNIQKYLYKLYKNIDNEDKVVLINNYKDHQYNNN